jgi:hypothetical protein
MLLLCVHNKGDNTHCCPAGTLQKFGLAQHSGLCDALSQWLLDVPFPPQGCSNI